MKTLSEFWVTIKGNLCSMFSNPQLVCGVGPAGDPTPINVDAQGNLADGGSGLATSFGVAGVRFTSADQSGGVADITDAPTAGQKLVITDIRFSADTAMRVDIVDQGNGHVLFSEYVPANGGGQITLRAKLKLSTANAKLGVQTSAAGNIAVTAAYYSEA